MNQFEYIGEWWLPENPDNKIIGTLKFHPIEGIDLELFGAFNESEYIKMAFNTNIILGTSSSGKSITLYECIQTSFRMGSSLTTYFRANVIFEGHHFKKEENIILDSLSINYSHLEEWTGLPAFKINTETDVSHKTIKKVRLPICLHKR